MYKYIIIRINGVCRRVSSSRYRKKKNKNETVGLTIYKFKPTII